MRCNRFWAWLSALGKAARFVYALGQWLEPGIVQGRIYQSAWNLLFFSLFAIAVAIALNWKNSRPGYWLNLTVISFGDIGFIVIVLMPGYIPLFPGIVGAALWILALALSSLGIMKGSRDFRSSQ